MSQLGGVKNAHRLGRVGGDMCSADDAAIFLDIGDRSPWAVSFAIPLRAKCVFRVPARSILKAADIFRNTSPFPMAVNPYVLV